MTCNQAVAVYHVFHRRDGRCLPGLNEGLVEPAAAPKVARLPKRINNRSILSRKRSMHDLQAFAKNVWIVEGPNVRDIGVMFTTRMIVVKLSDGSVWVNSPVPVPFDTLRHITAFGPVRYLVAATPRHVWRLEGWHTAISRSTAVGATNHVIYVEESASAIDGNSGGFAISGWADDFDQLAFKGNPFIEEVIFFHKESRTVILDDLIQIHPMVKGKPFRNALFKLEGVASPHGGVGLDIRLSFTDRNLRAASTRKAARVGLR